MNKLEQETYLLRFVYLNISFNHFLSLFRFFKGSEKLLLREKLVIVFIILIW